VVKNKYDTLDNFPGEVLTDIRALAAQFLIVFPNINTWPSAKWVFTEGQA